MFGLKNIVTGDYKMFNDNLDGLLSQKSKIKILRVLFKEADELSGREIAKKVNMSPSATYEALQKMKQENYLSVKRKGRMLLYSLKMQNYLIRKVLMPLFEREEAVYEEMLAYIKKGLLKNKEAVTSIVIFGSVAEGKPKATSDIDILIIAVSKTDKRRLDISTDRICTEVVKKYNVTISPYLLTYSEVRQKYARGEPIILSILNNNRLIYGEPMERIIA